MQNEFFQVVKSLAFRSDPDLQHLLWRFTPFIDYPQDGTTYDWRWEREWRVRGDLQFEPEHVALLVAPERHHETIREMWLWEALDADNGQMPPLIDVRWPYERQVATTRAGVAEIVSSLDEVGNPKQEVPSVPRTSLERPWEPPTESGWIVEIDDYAAYQAEVRAEQQAEWSHWLDEMIRDETELSGASPIALQVPIGEGRTPLPTPGHVGAPSSRRTGEPSSCVSDSSESRLRLVRSDEPAIRCQRDSGLGCLPLRLQSRQGRAGCRGSSRTWEGRDAGAAAITTRR